MPSFNKKSLIKRFISGFTLAPLVGVIIWQGGYLFWGLLLITAGFCLYEWLLLSRKTEHKRIYTFLGALYISFSFICCALILEVTGWVVAVFFMLVLWSSDVMAYFTGKFIGGPKMWPAVSPNKTWAGFGGALLGPTIMTAMFLGLFFPALLLAETSLYWFFGAILVGLVGQAGDLLVSALKRTAHTKDSGHLIPGHGGVLDRVDSLLLAAPVFLFYAYITNGALNV